MKHIIAEFRLITSSSSDGDRTVGVFNLRQVPSVGESVNIEGEPYVVYDRGWAIGDGGQYAYLRVTKLQAEKRHFHWTTVGGLPVSVACAENPCTVK